MPANLRQLTALRFFAALWVVAYVYWPFLSGPEPALVAHGHFGVELFFVLSGFILSHVYLEEAGAGRLDYGGFLWARLSRIYPVHLFTLAGVGLLGVAAWLTGYRIEHPVVVWSALPQTLLLIHAWNTTSVSAWNHASWSISSEWFAYLLFPLFAGAAWAVRRRPLLALSAVGVAVTVIYPLFQSLAGFPLTAATYAWGALRILPCFALGCACHLLWRGAPRPGAGLSSGLAALAAAGMVAACLLDAPEAVVVLLCGLLVYALAALSASGSRLLAWPWLVYMGEVSFALYMVCVPWQYGFAKVAARLLGAGDRLTPALWLLQLAGAVLAAILVHHAVERPARRWMRRRTPSWSARGASGTAPALATGA